MVDEIKASLDDDMMTAEIDKDVIPASCGGDTYIQYSINDNYDKLLNIPIINKDLLSGDAPTYPVATYKIGKSYTKMCCNLATTPNLEELDWDNVYNSATDEESGSKYSVITGIMCNNDLESMLYIYKIEYQGATAYIMGSFAVYYATGVTQEICDFMFDGQLTEYIGVDGWTDEVKDDDGIIPHTKLTVSSLNQQEIWGKWISPEPSWLSLASGEKNTYYRNLGKDLCVPESTINLTDKYIPQLTQLYFNTSIEPDAYFTSKINWSASYVQVDSSQDIEGYELPLFSFNGKTSLGTIDLDTSEVDDTVFVIARLDKLNTIRFKEPVYMVVIAGEIVYISDNLAGILGSTKSGWLYDSILFDKKIPDAVYQQDAWSMCIASSDSWFELNNGRIYFCDGTNYKQVSTSSDTDKKIQLLEARISELEEKLGK